VAEAFQSYRIEKKRPLTAGTIQKVAERRKIILVPKGVSYEIKHKNGPPTTGYRQGIMSSQCDLIIDNLFEEGRININSSDADYLLIKDDLFRKAKKVNPALPAPLKPEVTKRKSSRWTEAEFARVCGAAYKVVRTAPQGLSSKRMRQLLMLELGKTGESHSDSSLFHKLRESFSTQGVIACGGLTYDTAQPFLRTPKKQLDLPLDLDKATAENDKATVALDAFEKAATQAVLPQTRVITVYIDGGRLDGVALKVKDLDVQEKITQIVEDHLNFMINYSKT
jgi:hypothetical protein